MRTLTSILVLALLAPALFAADETCPITAWSYPEGTPSSWGGICAAGTVQSPISNNANQRTQAVLPSVDLDYVTGRLYPVTLKNTSVDLKAVPMFDGQLGYGPQKARLVQFHFHVPAEHQLDIWRDAAAELHLVHETATGEVIVVAVALIVGPENPAIRALQNIGNPGQCASRISRSDAQLVKMQALLPAERGRFITYAGSLTTPPCAEVVRFLLMNDGITATQTQIDFLKVLANGNARGPKQNGKPVTYRVAGQ
jgi:carbonic anhydrase